MDPNANLTEQASLLADTASNADKRRRATLRRALQEWLLKGGCDPDWKAHPQATKAYRQWVRDSRRFSDLWR